MLVFVHYHFADQESCRATERIKREPDELFLYVHRFGMRKAFARQSPLFVHFAGIVGALERTRKLLQQKAHAVRILPEVPFGEPFRIGADLRADMLDVRIAEQWSKIPAAQTACSAVDLRKHRPVALVHERIESDLIKLRQVPHLLQHFLVLSLAALQNLFVRVYRVLRSGVGCCVTIYRYYRILIGWSLLPI